MEINNVKKLFFIICLVVIIAVIFYFFWNNIRAAISPNNQSEQDQTKQKSFSVPSIFMVPAYYDVHNETRHNTRIITYTSDKSTDEILQYLESQFNRSGYSLSKIKETNIGYIIEVYNNKENVDIIVAKESPWNSSVKIVYEYN